MEYFIWFSMCYTLYRVFVLLGWIGGVVRDRYGERIEGFVLEVTGKQEEEDFPVVKGFDPVPDVLPEVPCVDGEVW